MKRSSFSTVLYVLLVFLSGGVVGAFAHRFFMLNTVTATVPTPPPDQWRTDYLSRMHSRLSLNADQMSKLEVILDETRGKAKDLKVKADKESFERSRPDRQAIQNEQAQKISAMLNETQRVEYEKFRAEMRAERDRRRQDQQKNAKPGPPPAD